MYVCVDSQETVLWTISTSIQAARTGRTGRSSSDGHGEAGDVEVMLRWILGSVKVC